MRRRFRPNEEPGKEKVLDVDASMQGTLSFNDPVNLRINGKFEGKLNTKGSLVIGENADVVADVRGEQITIAGKVRGNIKASKEIRVISPATIEGNLETAVLSVAEGSVINGNVKMSYGSKSQSSQEEILSVDEVAKYLEIEKSVVTEWAENGKLPGRKEGNRWRISRSVLDNWVANEKVS